MTETITKGELLARMQAEYEGFGALLSSLREQHMTTTGVNGSWSIKDILAHLTAWQEYLLDQLQGVVSSKQPPAFMPGLSNEDEINEHFYLMNKDRPLAEVRADFHASFARIVETTQAMSEDTLNAPFPWRQDGRIVWTLIADNTYEHYRHHGDTIRRRYTSMS